MPVSRRFVVFGLGLALAGCGGCGKAGSTRFELVPAVQPRETIVLPKEDGDTRPLVDTVLSMTVEPIPGGAVVRSRGVTPTQGWWMPNWWRATSTRTGCWSTNSG